MTDSPLTLRRKFHIATGRTGHRVVRDTAPPAPPPAGRIPRISRLMALAIRFEQLIRDGVVKDQADLARLAQITRPRSRRSWICCYWHRRFRRRFCSWRTQRMGR
jgi:hypothetical protein